MLLIKDKRVKLNITQEDLANKARILRTSLSRYEAGKRIPPLGTVVKIANALGCTVDDLLDKEEDYSANHS